MHRMSKYLGTKCFIVKRVHCNTFKDFHGKFINREYHVSVFRYQVYVARPETGHGEPFLLVSGQA